MRFLVYARISAEAGNKMFQDFFLKHAGTLKPEAAYFAEEWGNRTMRDLWTYSKETKSR